MDSYSKRTYLLPFNRETRRNVTVDGVEGLTAAVRLGCMDGLPTDQKSS